MRTVLYPLMTLFGASLRRYENGKYISSKLVDACPARGGSCHFWHPCLCMARHHFHSACAVLWGLCALGRRVCSHCSVSYTSRTTLAPCIGRLGWHCRRRADIYLARRGYPR